MNRTPIANRDGSWSVIVDIWRTVDGKRVRKQKRERFDSEADASAFARGTRIDADRWTGATLAGWIETWVADEAARLRNNGQRSYAAQITSVSRSILIPATKQMLATEFTARDVAQIWRALAARRPALSHKTLVNARSILARCVTDLIVHGGRDDNPVLVVPIPKTAGTAKQRRVSMTLDETRAAFGVIASLPVTHRYRLCWLIAAATGLRRGEICGLQVGDFDEQKRTLTVGRQLKLSHGGASYWMDGTTKTQNALRTLSLSEALVELVAKHVETRSTTTTTASSKLATCQDDHVSPNEMSAAFTAFAAARGWRPGEHPLHLHDLRHGFASAGLDAGLTVEDISAMLGHGDVLTTTHYLRSRQRLAVQTGSLAVQMAMLDG